MVELRCSGNNCRRLVWPINTRCAVSGFMSRPADTAHWLLRPQECGRSHVIACTAAIIMPQRTKHARILIILTDLRAYRRTILKENRLQHVKYVLLNWTRLRNCLDGNYIALGEICQTLCVYKFIYSDFLLITITRILLQCIDSFIWWYFPTRN